jgi:hypothetical protein
MGGSSSSEIISSPSHPPSPPSIPVNVNELPNDIRDSLPYSVRSDYSNINLQELMLLSFFFIFLLQNLNHIITIIMRKKIHHQAREEVFLLLLLQLVGNMH